jgi:alkylhydroperoxidase family enzyme
MLDMRSVTLASAILSVGALSLPAVLEAQSADCDRACLEDVMTRYLDSLVAHDPKKAPLADHARFTEDAKELPVGDGLWKTASKLRPFRTDFLDARSGTAAVHAVVEENGAPVLLAARLKVANRRITEVETIVVRNQQEGALFKPDSLAQPSAAMVAPPPKSALMPREAMIEIALRYPEGLRIGSFEKSDVPFAPAVYRLENGERMGGVGCTFRPPSCENMRSQQIPTLAAIEPAVVAVDEENGTVLLWMDFGKGSLPGPDGKALVTFEAFKVYGGQVHAVEAIFEGMPPDTPRGWAYQSAKLPADIHPVSLTRLPQLTRADLDAKGQAVYDELVGKDPVPTTGPRAVMLYSPEAAGPVERLNGFLRYNGDLSPRHTEVAICVAAWEIEQQYEYSAHEPAALRYGAPQAVIDTIKYNREPVGLSPEETLIIKFGRQLLREHKLDSELFAESVKLFGRKGTVELALVMGDYVMMGMVLTAIDQHLPPDRPALMPPR